MDRLGLAWTIVMHDDGMVQDVCWIEDGKESSR